MSETQRYTIDTNAWNECGRARRSRTRPHSCSILEALGPNRVPDVGRGDPRPTADARGPYAALAERSAHAPKRPRTAVTPRLRGGRSADMPSDARGQS
jgi:hypothetical protein